MKYSILRKKGYFSKFRVLILILAFVATIFIGSSLAVSIKYSLSPIYVGKQLARYSVLSAIYLSTLIYDPAVVKNTTLDPANNESIVNSADYIQIDKYFKESKVREALSIAKINNERIIKSRFNFIYQPYEEPRLDELRKKYKLVDVVSSAKDEFEAMILLRNWARSQFRRNDYQPIMENFDALEVLRRNIRNKDNEPYKPGQYRPCHFFPLFYTQVLLSMGYQARIVQISYLAGGGYGGHGMTEVWSNQYKKWITMGPDLNQHFEKDGIPINLLEFHNERYEIRPSRINIVRGKYPDVDRGDYEEIDIDRWIDYHSYIQVIDMRNDWMTNHYFRGHPKRSDRASLFWVDKNLPSVFNFKQKTDDVDDFYWTLNQTEILIKNDSNQKDSLELAFHTFTPNFKHFEIIVDDKEKIISTDFVHLWKLHPGANKLLVRSVNKFGVNGIPSLVELLVDREG